MSGTLYFGDNLDVLREHIRDESVDLIYLDPPFNSAASYNVLFKAPDGKNSTSQIRAFEDTWSWNDASERAFDDVMRCNRSEVSNVLRAMRQFLGENDMMAYLAMMAVRIIELHRALKHTGTLYLHCDPTASHYLKIILDATFGPDRFLNEVIWRRTSAHSNATLKLASVHDIVLIYTKGQKFAWNQPFTAYDDAYVREHFVHRDLDGRVFRRSDLVNPAVRPNLRYDYTASNGITYKPHHNGWKVSLEVMKRLDEEGRLFFPAKEDARLRKKIYLDESPGVPLTDVWSDLPPIHASSQERLGYPTQKPVALLERILQMSSSPGDVILDPFCGCGTAVHAAQKLDRRWVGIDVTPLAVNLIARRLKAAFPGIVYEVRGIPKDMDGARELAARDKHLFQLWATDLIGAQPYRDGKKGADGGIDGMVYFKPDGRTTKAAIVSVKGGANVNVAHIRDLRGTIERLHEPMGIFVTLHPPSEPMRREAAAAGLYDAGFGKPTPKIQIVTIEDALKLGDRAVQIPYGHSASFKQAPRETKPDAQHAFDIAGSHAAGSKAAARDKKRGVSLPGKLRQVATNRSRDLIDLASEAALGLHLIAADDGEGNEILIPTTTP
ncbi:restriction endonuclease [Methylobacterium sp. J-030]|uniref:DNA methyltransferase n=1 Tax=Methylobacterium sp. J-030 TaxID=2836627 RepID=UPI001FB8860E|nr:DNA methyltransferase [Methylobacterium sp. J-030]MCJ2067810.1 restriction endonuclease [Methylobacterium sp. J-030]